MTTTIHSRRPHSVSSPTQRPLAHRIRFARRRFQWISTGDQWWLEAYGFADLEQLLNLPGSETVLPDQRREVVRLPHPMATSDEPQLVLKRYWRVSSRDRLRSWARFGRLWSRARRELEILRKMRTLGIQVPRPLVCLEQGLMATQSALLIEEMPQSRNLIDFLHHAGANLVDGERRKFFLQLGAEVARLHSTGFAHRSLTAGAITVMPGVDGSEFGFQQVAHARQMHYVGLRRRADDLALLTATLSDRLFTELDRQRLCDSYIHKSHLESQASEFLQWVDQRRQRLLRRRQTWEIREGNLSSLELDRATRVRTNLWVDPEFRPALEQSGLNDLAAILATTAGKCLRVLKDRENWRLDLPHSLGPRGAYLKKHHVRTWHSRLRAALAFGPGETSGRVEARNIARLNRAGIVSMRLIAFGERLSASGNLESFVLTQELAGFTQLDHFLKQRFVDSPLRSQRESHALRSLIGSVADVAGKFHQLGYNHRDFYCCHFFIKEPLPGEFQVNLIDLQRVEHRRRGRRRWIVKDLAQLAYSAPQTQISCTTRLAFMKRYLGRTKLLPRDKRLIRQILAKQKLMEWQLGKHP